MEHCAELALADLEVGPPRTASLTFLREECDADHWHLLATFDDFAAGFNVTLQDEPALLVAVADGLQQAFIEHLWRGVPLCPLHEHPLVARLSDGQARWCCPAADDWSCAIGAYHEAAAGSAD